MPPPPRPSGGVGGGVGGGRGGERGDLMTGGRGGLEGIVDGSTSPGAGSERYQHDWLHQVHTGVTEESPTSPGLGSSPK